LDIAYDHDLHTTANSTNIWLEQWAAREFGSRDAKEIADIVSKYGLYASRRKYELVVPTTYSIINYDEGERVLADWVGIERRAQAIYDRIPKDAKAAFFQLVLHPCRAGRIVHEIHYTVGRNNIYAGQRRTSTNYYAQHAQKLFNDDHKLTVEYHSLLGGKWDHMMDQTHLGSDYW
jgi:hypothetical protein